MEIFWKWLTFWNREQLQYLKDIDYLTIRLNDKKKIIDYLKYTEHDLLGQYLKKMKDKDYIGIEKIKQICIDRYVFRLEQKYYGTKNWETQSQT